MPLTINAVHISTMAGAVKATAVQLARLAARQHAPIQTVGTGTHIASGSCWAALAAVPDGADYKETDAEGNAVAAGHGLGYAAVFGQSRMAAIEALSEGSVAGYERQDGGHAEKAALGIAAGHHLSLHQAAPNEYVIYVLLAPCGNCARWLASDRNPYHGVDGRLNVGYLFAYPPADDRWKRFNALKLEDKLAAIDRLAG